MRRKDYLGKIKETFIVMGSLFRQADSKPLKVIL
jgi:hypothetical protein